MGDHAEAFKTAERILGAAIERASGGVAVATARPEQRQAPHVVIADAQPGGRQTGCLAAPAMTLTEAGHRVPFGGIKAPSYGPRERDRYAVECCTQGKTPHPHAGEARR